MSEPLVSIVTPTYQRHDLLERTLRSVRAQRYPNVEHIVVDGGSTDGTTDLLETYARTYRLTWRSEPDHGMYDAINKGLRMASGEVMAYLNSDDCYFPWSVGSAVSALQDDPRAGLVYGDVLRADERHRIVVPVFQPHSFARPLAAFGSLLQPTVFFRASLYERLGGFDDGLRYVADLDYWLRASRVVAFRRIDEFLALELFHEGTLSEGSRDAMSDEDRRMRSRHRQSFWATALGRQAAMLGWYASASARWLTFALAANGIGRGWAESREALGPRVSLWETVRGLRPSRASTSRAGVRYHADPRSVVVDG